MITISTTYILVAFITAFATVIAAVIGASKYGKRKAETNMFAEFRASSVLMQESSRDTIIDLRATNKYVIAEREVMHTERNQMREQRDKAIEQRDEAISELDCFKKDFDKMKDLIQSNTAEIELIKLNFCIDGKCVNRKTA